MASREVTVQVTATYTIKVIAGNANEAIKKAEDFVLYGQRPTSMDSVILDVSAHKRIIL